MDDYRRSDEIAVRTPPTYSRTPVHLRLSINRRDTSPYDAEYDDEQPQEDVRKYLSRSNSRKDRSSYEHEEHQEDVRRYLSRSSSRKTRSMPEPEYEYYEDEPRRSLTRFPSKRDRLVFDHEEDGTRRQLSRSSSRKARPEYEAEEEYPADLLEYDADVLENGMEDAQLSERRKAMFEPLGPSYRGPRDGSPDSNLPPPDFDVSSYPQGWVVGKKRKLVNVDVVESMRRIAVHEMNRKVLHIRFWWFLCFLKLGVYSSNVILWQYVKGPIVACYFCPCSLSVVQLMVSSSTFCYLNHCGEYFPDLSAMRFHAGSGDWWTERAA